MQCNRISEHDPHGNCAGVRGFGTHRPPSYDYLELDKLEEIYMGGMQDEISGDVESPTGHFYRVCRQIVKTDSQGFREVLSFNTEQEAREIFSELDEEFSEWSGDE